jgi:hypothetical protein
MRKRGANVVCPGERIFGYIPNDLFPLGRHPRLQPTPWEFGGSSHVLLAACGASEGATESDGRLRILH